MAKKSGSSEKKNGSTPEPQTVRENPIATARWSEKPDEHDYPAAAAYLSLICEPHDVRKLVAALKAAPLLHHKAKDLLRSSGLALLPEDNFHVASDLAKIARGEALSPVLLVRGDFRRGMLLNIADGYHRICASYHVSENADIPCHLVDHRVLAPDPGFRLGGGVTMKAGVPIGAADASGAGSEVGSVNPGGSASGGHEATGATEGS
jgi:hypothetical protein